MCYDAYQADLGDNANTILEKFAMLRSSLMAAQRKLDYRQVEGEAKHKVSDVQHYSADQTHADSRSQADYNESLHGISTLIVMAGNLVNSDSGLSHYLRHQACFASTFCRLLFRSLTYYIAVPRGSLQVRR